MPASHSPVVDAFALASDRGELRGEFALARLPRLAAMLLDRVGSLSYAIQGRIDAQGRHGATMQLQADLVLRCERCNSPVTFRLEREAQFRFAADENELASWPIEDDEFEDVVGSRHMDLAEWVEDEAILSLPVVPRHAACRAPGSHQSPDADEVVVARPFAALAGFKAARRDN